MGLMAAWELVRARAFLSQAVCCAAPRSTLFLGGKGLVQNKLVLPEDAPIASLFSFYLFSMWQVTSVLRP